MPSEGEGTPLSSAGHPIVLAVCVGAAAQGRTLSWPPSIYTAKASHSSNLLIGLLLSIGISVIGYFTLVRLGLAESKGQAASLSGPSKLVLHQL